MVARSLLKRTALFAVLIGACNGASDTLSVTSDGSLYLIVDHTTLTSLGDTIRLKLVLLDASGKVIPISSVAWASTNIGILRIDSSTAIMVKDTATMRVTGLSNGVANVVATVGNASVTNGITVSQQVARYRVVTATGDSAMQFSSFGDTMTAFARPIDARGNTVVGATPPAVLATSNTSMITVNATTGVMTAVGSSLVGGFYTPSRIYAQGAVTDSMWAYVLQIAATMAINGPRDDTVAVGEQKTFTALPRDARGNAITAGLNFWLSRNQAVFQVDSVTGRVRGISAGKTFLIGARDSKRDSITVVVK